MTMVETVELVAVACGKLLVISFGIPSLDLDIVDVVLDDIVELGTMTLVATAVNVELLVMKLTEDEVAVDVVASDQSGGVIGVY